MQDQLFDQPNNTVSMADVLNEVNKTEAATPEEGMTPENSGTYFDSANGYENVTANEFQQPFAQQAAPEQAPGINAGDFIDKEMAVALLDGVMVSVCVAAGKMLKIKVTKAEVKASAEEKKLLEKPVGEAMKAANIRITNPWEALAISVIAIYGGKMFGAWAKKSIDSEEAESVEDINDLNQVAQIRKRKPGGGRKRKAIEA